MENNSLVEKFKNEVKHNKKYKSLSDDVVIKEIKIFLKKNPFVLSPEKIYIKEIRKKLHRSYSSYQTKKKNKRASYLLELQELIKENKDMTDLTDKFLSITLSTIERKPDYSYIYDKIFRFTGDIKTVVDLGAGLNALSYPLMRHKKLNYYSYDIDTNDIVFLNKYFEILRPIGLNGCAEILDVTNIKLLSSLPLSDVVFMFKLIDLIHVKKTKLVEEIITVLKNRTHNMVFSFSTITLTRKKMQLQKRSGFEKLLTRLGLKFESFRTSTEIFYLVRC